MTTGQDIIDFIKQHDLTNNVVEMCIPQDLRECVITFQKPMNGGIQIFYLKILAKRDYNLSSF